MAVKTPRLQSPSRLLAVSLFALSGFLRLSAADISSPDISVRAGYRWTENVSRSSGRRDFRDASEYELGVAAGYNRQLTPRIYAHVEFGLTGTVSPDYELLDHTDFGPRLTLKRKFGLGPYAPVLSAQTDLSGRLARLDEQQGFGARETVTLSKRFSPWLSAAVSGEWQGFMAERSAFSVSHFTADARVTVDPHPLVRFSAGASRLDGSFTASASRNRFVNGALAGALGPDVASYFATIPWARTDIFEAPWISYRVRGYVDAWWFEYSPSFTERTGLTLRYERNHAVSVVHTEYRQDILTLSVNHVF